MNAEILCRLVLAAAVLWTVAPRSADAHVLPVRYVLKKASQRLATAQSLQVALVGRARAGDTPDGSVGVAERWIFDRRQHTVRVDANGPGGRKAAWSRGGSTSGDAGLLPSVPERMVFTRLFGDGDVEALARDLGVDLERQRLGLVGDQVAVVVGSHSRDDSSAQIWFDHDDFTVLRVRWKDLEGRLVDVETSSWAGPPTRGLFPQRVRVVVGGRWMRVMEADDLRSQPP